MQKLIFRMESKQLIGALCVAKTSSNTRHQYLRNTYSAQQRLKYSLKKKLAIFLQVVINSIWKGYPLLITADVALE